MVISIINKNDGGIMARTTVYNNITDEESLSQILPENKMLTNDFLDYLKSIDRSPNTITQYKSDLDIFFVYNLKYNNNKRFTEITKREFARFQNHVINEWKWSPKRTRRVKSVLSSLSNYIEDILDEEPEYENYRSTIKKIESPINQTVRDKTVFSEEEIQSLLDWLVEQKKYRQACCVALAASSGRRKSEIPRFKVSFFDDENVIFGSLYKTPEKVQTKGRGSKGKQIQLYVLKKQFDPYLKLWLQERSEKDIESEWLFPNMNDYSQPMSTDSMDGWTESYTKYLGKDFYWHSLRHYFTTALVKNNIPTNVIQDIVNWESADMVNLYTDISADENIGKYFDENGIKQVEHKSLSDI